MVSKSDTEVKDFSKNIDLKAPDLSQNDNDGENILLMCKDEPVYNITRDEILNKELLPGAMQCGTMNYSEWMGTRYSAGTNISARRLMLRAFGTDNHNKTLKITRALSLSDCYWLKQQDEKILFNDVTPYLNEEWQGDGIFTGGSISTLFVNGQADKKWLDSKTLLKVNSIAELDAYKLCEMLGFKEYASKAVISKTGILVTNFTSPDFFLESMEQSGFIGENDDARFKSVEMFKEQAVALFVIDYLVEHDDRHWGNIGFIRDANTGKYLSMAPYYDFDWIWTDGVVKLPENALQNYRDFILNICNNAKDAAVNFEKGNIIKKRAEELLRDLI